MARIFKPAKPGPASNKKVQPGKEQKEQKEKEPHSDLKPEAGQ